MKKIVYTFLQIVWIVYCWFALSGMQKTSDFSDNVDHLYWIIVISFVLGLLETYYLSGKKVSITTAFLVITYIFHHGQHFLDFLGIDFEYYKGYIMTNFVDKSIVNATIFSIMAINFLQLGFCLMLNDKDEDKKSYRYKHSSKRQPNSLEDSEKAKARTELLLKWSIALFAVSLIPTLIYDVQRMIVSFSASYAETYTYGTTAINSILSQFFEIAIFGLIYCLKDTKKWKYFYYSKFFWELIKLLLIGNRMGPISSIAALFFLKQSIIVSDNKRKGKLKYIVLAILLVFVMGFISSYRSGKAGTTLTEALENALVRDNMFISFFAESGTTLLDQALLFRLMPGTLAFANGLTYINSILILLPMSTTIFGASATEHISIGAILNEHWYNRGLGGSIVAESYYNFGENAIWFMLIIGLAVGWFQKKYDSSASKGENGMLIILLTFLLEQLLIYPRGYFYSVIASVNIIIYALVVYLLVKMFFDSKKVKA
ncbi:MAG: O-antigen polysaccharide polymerase Wzy [Ruminococcaceae bacterium]|nr:O-antigen polysaccharide polymerase Wzy [Oscillospiraceae bacterium]